MWERSNSPAAARTARCSSRMPAYWRGISHPANSTIFAPSDSCRSSSGVGVSAIGCASVIGAAPLLLREIRERAVRCHDRGASDERPLRLEGQERWRLVERDPANLVELVVMPREVTASGDHEEVVDRLVDAGPSLHEPVLDRVERADDLHLEAGLLAHLAEGRLLGRLVRIGGALGEGPRHAVTLALALADDEVGGAVREPDHDATSRGGGNLLQAGHAGATEERRCPPPRVELVHSIED